MLRSHLSHKVQFRWHCTRPLVKIITSNTFRSLSLQSQVDEVGLPGRKPRFGYSAVSCEHSAITLVLFPFPLPCTVQPFTHPSSQVVALVWLLSCMEMLDSRLCARRLFNQSGLLLSLLLGTGFTLKDLGEEIMTAFKISQPLPHLMESKFLNGTRDLPAFVSSLLSHCFFLPSSSVAWISPGFFSLVWCTFLPLLWFSPHKRLLY